MIREEFSRAATFKAEVEGVRTAGRLGDEKGNRVSVVRKLVDAKKKVPAPVGDKTPDLQGAGPLGKHAGSPWKKPACAGRGCPFSLGKEP